MKKTLLLSVVASTMIMAGGDIAPVEPVVVAEEVSAWNFSGQAVAYYQTTDGSWSFLLPFIPQFSVPQPARPAQTAWCRTDRSPRRSLPDGWRS